jgi:hypothetical protein
MSGESRRPIRELGLELFRLDSMFLIIWFHLGGYLERNRRVRPVKSVIDHGIRPFFSKAINGMVLISGICMTRLNVARVFRLWLSVVFYANWWFRLWILVDRRLKFHWTWVFLPIYSRIWWFMSAYVIMCFFAPGVNAVAASLTRYQCLLAIFLVLCLELSCYITGDTTFFVPNGLSPVLHFLELFFFRSIVSIAWQSVSVFFKFLVSLWMDSSISGDRGLSGC